MAEAKKHHYLSQFYLKGFTLDNNKTGQLFCYNIQSRSIRSSKPLNEGYVKHFNKIESNYADPNILEKELSKMESSLSKIFNYIAQSKKLPQNDDFKLLIYYLALLGTRNPQIRTDFSNFKEKKTEKFFNIILRNKLIWENQIKDIPELQNEKYKNVSYENMKSFISEKRWKLVEPNEIKVSREFKGVEKVYQLLMGRNWSIVIIDNNEDYFVTSDRPVKNIWSDANSLNFGPGFGVENSELYFPLSKTILLRGSYRIEQTVMIANRELIAVLNSIQFQNTARFIYSPIQDFILLNSKGEIVNSTAI